MAEPVYTVVKTITIGDFNVGKTSLMTREVLNTYTDNFAATIGIDFRLKNYQVGEMSVKGQLWDSWAGGGERFFPMNTHLYRGTPLEN
jgi:GTPase SAR1 family protein